MNTHCLLEKILCFEKFILKEQRLVSTQHCSQDLNTVFMILKARGKGPGIETVFIEIWMDNSYCELCKIYNRSFVFCVILTLFTFNITQQNQFTNPGDFYLPRSVSSPLVVRIIKTSESILGTRLVLSRNMNQCTYFWKTADWYTAHNELLHGWINLSTSKENSHITYNLHNVILIFFDIW